MALIDARQPGVSISREAIKFAIGEGGIRQLPYLLIDGPSPFDSVETWERFLAEVQAMPDFVTKQMEIRSAKWMPMMQRDRALTCLFKNPIRVSE
jgi:hypothetical protein